MKTKLFFLIFFSSSLFCYGQPPPTIKKVEIYALPFMTEYIINIDKNDIKKKKPLYVRVVDMEEISRSNISRLTSNLVKVEDSYFPYDYRAMFILHYSNSKRHTYYIASGSWGIVSKNKLYKVNYPLIAAIYSFLPDEYFTSWYEKYPEVFK